MSSNSNHDGEKNATEKPPALPLHPEKPASDALDGLELLTPDGDTPRSRLPSSGLVRAGRLPK